jgi:hypothetical protein
MTVGYLETLNNDLVRGKANVLGERYSDIYDQYQEILPQAKLIGRELADYEKKQIQDVEGIRNVYARMVAENSRLHHDSKEYKDMMILGFVVQGQLVPICLVKDEFYDRVIALLQSRIDEISTKKKF